MSTFEIVFGRCRAKSKYLHFDKDSKRQMLNTLKTLALDNKMMLKINVLREDKVVSQKIR